MTSRALAGALVASGLLLWQDAAHAEDIDLFVQPSGASAGIPNVLIILDNTANWSRSVDGQAIVINEIDALTDTLANIPVNDDGSPVIRIGLMLYTETGNPNSTVKGGYVRAAVRDMTAANKTLYINLFNGLNANGDKSDGGKAGLAMAEAWRYYDGIAPYAGNNKVKTD
jgi:type IV pilus assembly protein PilY1